MRNCFEGYLTPDCASCPYWADGTEASVGCATPFPIMHCSSFARMYNLMKYEKHERRDK